MDFPRKTLISQRYVHALFDSSVFSATQLQFPPPISKNNERMYVFAQLLSDHSGQVRIYVSNEEAGGVILLQSILRFFEESKAGNGNKSLIKMAEKRGILNPRQGSSIPVFRPVRSAMAISAVQVVAMMRAGFYPVHAILFRERVCENDD